MGTDWLLASCKRTETYLPWPANTQLHRKHFLEHQRNRELWRRPLAGRSDSTVVSQACLCLSSDSQFCQSHRHSALTGSSKPISEIQSSRINILANTTTGAIRPKGSTMHAIRERTVCFVILVKGSNFPLYRKMHRRLGARKVWEWRYYSKRFEERMIPSRVPLEAGFGVFFDGSKSYFLRKSNQGRTPHRSA